MPRRAVKIRSADRKTLQVVKKAAAQVDRLWSAWLDVHHEKGRESMGVLDGINLYKVYDPLKEAQEEFTKIYRKLRL